MTVALSDDLAALTKQFKAKADLPTLGRAAKIIKSPG